MDDNERDLRQKVFAFSKNQSARPLNRCMWPWAKCERKAIRAHSVQNSRVLEILQRQGHVVMPRLYTSFDGGPVVRFEEVGRNKATTFTGLCSAHDARLFAPIEREAFELKSPEHLFLVAYRAALKESHASLKAAIDVQSTFLKGAEVGLFSLDEPSAPGMMAVEHMISSYQVHQVRKQFEVAYFKKSWSSINHFVIQVDAPPSIAVNSMFTTGMWSKETDSPAMVCFNVLPYRSRTAVVFSSVVEHKRHVSAAFDRIIFSSGHYQRYELSKLILRRCENIVISPSHFDLLSPRQKDTIIGFFARNIAPMEYDIDDQSLDIFTPHQVRR